MSGARLLMPGLRLPGDLDRFDDFVRLAARGVAGFCLFGGDRALPALLERLLSAAPHPLLIAADLEQGAGQQVEGTTRHPPAAALDPEAAELAGIRTACEARLLGITMTFAPVCDVASEPRNPIIAARAFRDPATAAPRFVNGARLMGLRTCAKLFPGHGATLRDSHDALPLVETGVETWRVRDRPPFAACIAAGVDAVMTAHLAWPALTGSQDRACTFSRRVVTELLRGELGFDGLVVTDALLMEGARGGRGEVEAAEMALEAGCDLLLFPEDVEGVLAFLERVDPGPRLERLARAAEPLPDPLAAAAAASVSGAGDLPPAPGPHPLRICDLLGGGEELARAAGLAFERYGPQGQLLERGSGPGLECPALAVLRRDRAWAGPLVVPEAVRALADPGGLVILLGPRVLLEGLAHSAFVHAPGQDPLTLAAVCRKAFGR